MCCKFGQHCATLVLGFMKVSGLLGIKVKKGVAHMQNGQGLQAHFTQQVPMLECAKGVCTTQYSKDIAKLMFDPECWQGLALDSRNTSSNQLAFKMLSRGSATTFALLESAHRKYPYRLFLPLADGGVSMDTIARESPCLWDDFTTDHRRQYPSVEACCSEASLLQLRGLAVLARPNIAHIEARHAAIRRACLRSISWSKSLLQVSADFFFMRQRISERTGRAKGSVKPKRQRRGKKRVVRRKPSQTKRAVARRKRRQEAGKPTGRKGSVAAFSLFFGEHCQGRGLPSAAERAAISASWAALPQVDPEKLRLLRVKARQLSRARRAMLDPETRHRVLADRRLGGVSDLATSLAVVCADVAECEDALPDKLKRIRTSVRHLAQSQRRQEEVEDSGRFSS